MCKEGEDRLDPEIVDYCHYIISNFESIEKSDVGSTYGDEYFNMKEATAIDEHLKEIVEIGKLKVTESSYLTFEELGNMYFNEIFDQS